MPGEVPRRRAGGGDGAGGRLPPAPPREYLEQNEGRGRG
jgi:hypothetical protein